MRGYRLSKKAKVNLLALQPQRFSFALSDSAETNHIKTEPLRRLRLHRVAEATITMQNAGVLVHRDEKPDIFRPFWIPAYRPSISVPVFYNSREIKEIGTAFVKAHGARCVGVMLAPDAVFVTYDLGDSLIKWSYKAEMRTKALFKSVLCNDRLVHQYKPGNIHGLLLGNDLESAYHILSGKQSEQHFILDGNYEHFYFLTNDRYGERLLQLLCNRKQAEQLECILLGDCYENDCAVLESDALDSNGDPVLLGHTMDLPRIHRFHTALQLQGKYGTLICFDFQQDILRRYCCDRVKFQIIDFDKWERRFFVQA